jgi:DNA-binding transcriptional regulator YhcF (GntR family)
LHIDYDSLQPIYAQIAEGIEDDIILGRLKEGEPVYSQLVLSRELQVNPATAAKGINLLVQKGILEKQRGQSMTVAVGARSRLLKARREDSFQALARNLLSEAAKIGLTSEQVLEELRKIIGEERKS